MRLDYVGGLQTIFYNLNLLTTASQLPKPRFIQITQTTVSNEIHARPAISGDGSFAAYVQEEGEGLGHLFVGRTDGTAPTQVVLPELFVSRMYGVAIGGDRILFVGCPAAITCASGADAAGDLYVVNTDGTGLRQLTTGGAQLPQSIPPSFSADGSTVVYATANAWFFGGPVTVITIGATAVTTRQLSLPIARFTSVRVNRDGSRVAFPSVGRSADGRVTFDLTVAMTASGATTTVVANIGLPPTEVDFTFSGDGQTIAMKSGPGLFTIHADGTGFTLLDQLGGGQAPSLTSDGSTVAYVADSTFDLVLANADRTVRRHLTWLQGVNLLGRRIIIHPAAISANGNAVVFLSNADLNTGKNVDGSTEVFVAVLEPISPLADLAITKTASPDPAASAGTLTYTLTVQNIGGSPAGNVTVTDNLPAGLTNVQCSVPCSIGAGTVTTALGTIAVSAQTSFTISGNAPVVSVATAISNTVIVSTSSPETTTANNQATATTTVTPATTALACDQNGYITNRTVPFAWYWGNDPTDNPTRDAGSSVRISAKGENGCAGLSAFVRILDPLSRTISTVTRALRPWAADRRRRISALHRLDH